MQVEPGGGDQDEVETITHQIVNIAGEPQMLQVLSLKDSPALSKVIGAPQSGMDVKPQEAPTITGD